MACVFGATGVLGSAACCKEGRGGGGSEGNQTVTGASAAGEIASLVSVMSGQSLSVLGPEIGHAASCESPGPPCMLTDILYCFTDGKPLCNICQSWPLSLITVTIHPSEYV